MVAPGPDCPNPMLGPEGSAPFLAPVIGQTVSSGLELQNATQKQGLPALFSHWDLPQDSGQGHLKDLSRLGSFGSLVA